MFNDADSENLIWIISQNMAYYQEEKEETTPKVLSYLDIFLLGLLKEHFSWSLDLFENLFYFIFLIIGLTWTTAQNFWWDFIGFKFVRFLVLF